MPPSAPTNLTARQWLCASGYDDVNDLIERIMAEWRRKGLGTRKDWCEKLAGTYGGKPCVVDGITLPILRAARTRKGWPAVPGALDRGRDLPLPEVKPQARWAK